MVKRYIISEEYVWVNIRFPYIAQKLSESIMAIFAQITQNTDEIDKTLINTTKLIEAIRQNMTQQWWYPQMNNMIWDIIEKEVMFLLIEWKKRHDGTFYTRINVSGVSQC